MRFTMGLVLGLVLVLGGLAGCGSAGEDDGIATANGKKTPSGTASAKVSDDDRILQHARCLRQHGLDVPDPTTNPQGGTHLGAPEGTDPKKAEAAMDACKHLLPNGGEPQKVDPKVLEQIRQMSKCMRANGVPKFPDPDPNGGIQVKGGPGLDPNSPEFKAAEKKCQRYQPKGPGSSSNQVTE